MAETVHLDNKTLETLRGFMNADKLAMLLERYMDDSERLIQQLEQACLQQDQEIARRCAHSLKSTSANVGALALAAIARALEEQAHRGELAAVQLRLAELREAFKMARAAIVALSPESERSARSG